MSDINIKVYKTTVDNREQAKEILRDIREELPESCPSFDLENCDKVLRVESKRGVKEVQIKKIIKNYGHQMEVLP
ncbi:hypothetical protein [Gracilimonas sp. BCB1]|uniref:hypothetical protein n=1 Tax=Gracilimonas sp. BCB1 TaxID=3152362 RepID=UPI0032D8F869